MIGKGVSGSSIFPTMICQKQKHQRQTTMTYIYIYISGLRTNHLGRGNHLTKERSRHSVEIKERLRMILGFCYFMNAVAVGFLDFWKVFFWNFGSTKYLGLVYLRFWPSNWRDQDSLQYIYIYPHESMES